MGRSAAAGVVAVCCAACATLPVTTPSTAATTAPSGLARYLPLVDGTVFAYESSVEPSGEHGLLMLEVRRPRENAAELIVAGRVNRLDVTPNAVAYAAGGSLLREPLTPGAEWTGDFGSVHVTRVEANVTVPAGSFAGCVETVEELTTRDGNKRTTTAFCPGVGITQRRTDVEQNGEQQSERIALKSFGKKFEGSAGRATDAK